MSDEENYPRITITLPPDLAAWVKLKKDELDAKDRRMKTSVSAIIADAVADMKARDQANESGKSTPQNNLIRPSTETYGGGYLTPKTARYQKGGRRKSTT
jgi:hypothetical protein